MKRVYLMIIGVLITQHVFADFQEAVADLENPSLQTDENSLEPLAKEQDNQPAINKEQQDVEISVENNKTEIDPSTTIARYTKTHNCNLDIDEDYYYEWNFCDADFYAYADWLYWKVARCDLDLGVINGVEVLSNTVVDVAQMGDTIDFAFKNHSGARAGAGFELCNRWGFGFEYTYFNPKKSRKIKVNDNSVLTISRIPGLLELQNRALIPNSIDGVYELQLNQLDLQLTYSHGCEPCREIRTFFGTRLAWIDDSLRTNYRSLSIDPADAKKINENFSISLEEKSKLNAYGLIVGGQLFQDLWYALGLYAKATVGVLYSSYDCHSATLGYKATTVLPISGFNVEDNYNCLLSTIDLALGLGFEGCEFCCVTWHFIMGYELHHFIPFRDYSHPLTGSANLLNVFIRNKTDFGFNGLFVRLGLEF